METLVNNLSEAGTTKPKPMGRIAKLLFSMVWLALLLEVVPRLFWATNLISHHRVARAVLGWDESSWRMNWVYLHRTYEASPPNRAGNMTGGWTGTYAISHPTRGWALTPDVRNDDFLQPGAKFVTSNSKGLRGTREYAYARAPGKQRVLVLGDSFTFGTDVSDNETYSHYLESILLETEVLNLGVQGYGQDQMLLYLREEGIKYHPDIVVLGFVSPDIYRNLWNFFAFAKPKFVMTADGLEQTGVPVPTPEYVLAREPYRSKAIDVVSVLREKLRWGLGINERKARELAREILDEIVSTTRGIGAVPVLVYLPVSDEISDLNDSKLEHEQYLYDYCRERNVACLFLRPRFAAEIENGAGLETRSHWNAGMHQVAALEIAHFLVARGLIQETPAPAGDGRQASHTQ
jgi:hypothetical protein